jgi:hypothetical protein
MPYCTNCRTEYVAGTARCMDCGAMLVESPPPPWPRAGAPEEIKPAELCEVDSQVQADLIEAQLRAAAIPFVRRPRGLAVFVPGSHLAAARRAMEGKPAMAPPETLGLSELHRIVLVCEECDNEFSIDLLEEKPPEKCPSCGHQFDLTAARPVLDRYADLMRTMAEADFEIEVEVPAPEGEERSRG